MAFGNPTPEIDVHFPAVTVMSMTTVEIPSAKLSLYYAQAVSRFDGGIRAYADDLSFAYHIEASRSIANWDNAHR